MNYIKRLEMELRTAKRRISEMEDAMRNFHTELSYSTKFLGFDDDGDRKDWIASKDVTYWIEMVLMNFDG